MADSLQLTYSQILTAVREERFPASSPADQWIAAGYLDIWNSGEWTFKRVDLATFWTTADGLSNGTPDETPLMPAAFAKAIVLLDDTGSEVTQVRQDDLNAMFTDPVSSVVTGRPQVYAVSNRQIALYPKPDRAYQFRLSYRRRVATRQTGGAVQAGLFQADTDLPLWDDHHYIIVVRARILGLRDRSDPTNSDLLDDYGMMLAAMREEYMEELPIGTQAPAWR